MNNPILIIGILLTLSGLPALLENKSEPKKPSIQQKSTQKNVLSKNTTDGKAEEDDSIGGDNRRENYSIKVGFVD